MVIPIPIGRNSHIKSSTTKTSSGSRIPLGLDSLCSFHVKNFTSKENRIVAESETVKFYKPKFKYWFKPLFIVNYAFWFLNE
jgi:hypothetical protein